MANGDNLILGGNNSAADTTHISRTGEPVFRNAFLTTFCAVSIFDDFVDGIDSFTTQGDAVSGLSDESTGIYGQSDNGNGVEGYARTGHGVNGFSEHANGINGVSHKAIGIYGESLIPTDDPANTFQEDVPGVGIRGVNNQNGGIGVFGSVDYPDLGYGTGVYGRGNTLGVGGNGQTGLIGHGSQTGVYAYLDTYAPGGGEASLANPDTAGFFNGNVKITGCLYKGGGGFRIDHPSDPANKYLNHSFVESPDMKNIYDGESTLNSKGEILVKLPSWFTLLNKDFRYQLTSIGTPAPNLHIAQEINENQFSIAGGKPNSKVCWQVTGIRDDAWANANRIVAEEKKPETEKGYFLHPELYNIPNDKNIKWAMQPKQMVKSKPIELRKKAVAEHKEDEGVSSKLGIIREKMKLKRDRRRKD
jgi:hypothetical protein